MSLATLASAAMAVGSATPPHRHWLPIPRRRRRNCSRPMSDAPPPLGWRRRGPLPRTSARAGSCERCSRQSWASQCGPGEILSHVVKIYSTFALFAFGQDHLEDRVLSFFSSRQNWDSPTPSPAGEPPPLVRGGGEVHTRLWERVWWGVQIPTRGQTLWNSRYICTLWAGPRGHIFFVEAYRKRS